MLEIIVYLLILMSILRKLINYSTNNNLLHKTSIFLKKCSLYLVSLCTFWEPNLLNILLVWLFSKKSMNNGET